MVCSRFERIDAAVWFAAISAQLRVRTHTTSFSERAVREEITMQHGISFIWQHGLAFITMARLSAEARQSAERLNDGCLPPRPLQRRSDRSQTRHHAQSAPRPVDLRLCPAVAAARPLSNGRKTTLRNGLRLGQRIPSHILGSGLIGCRWAGISDLPKELVRKKASGKRAE